MCSLDKTIRSRIVARNSNVVDVVLLRWILDRLNKWTSIVRHYLHQSAPSTKDILEKPISKGHSVLRSQLAKFDVVEYRAPALDYIAIATGLWHVHRVGIDFRK